MDNLTQEIVECDKKIARLEAQIADLKSYRRGLDRALRLTSSSISQNIQTGQKTRRSRGFSPTWTQILGFIKDGGDFGKSLDDIMAFSSLENLDVNRNTARSQLHTMKASGIIERLSDGRVRLTSKGLEAVGSPKGESPTALTVGLSDSQPILTEDRTRGVGSGTGGA